MDITIATEVAAALAALPYLLKGIGEADKAVVGGDVTGNILIGHNWD